MYASRCAWTVNRRGELTCVNQRVNWCNVGFGEAFTFTWLYMDVLYACNAAARKLYATCALHSVCDGAWKWMN